jgi:hypothetical protein
MWGPPLPMSCTRCRTDKKLRRAWGCDTERRKGIVDRGVRLFERCLECGGSGGPCRACKGEGAVVMKRCPYARLRADAQGIVEDVAVLEAAGLPETGGLPRQAAQWWGAAKVVLVEKEKLDKLRRGKT